VVWERHTRGRYRAFTVKQIEQMEALYQKWDHNSTDVAFEDGLLNFAAMKLNKKTKMVTIRRSFQTGLLAQWRASLHSTQVHVKLHHLQIDNQASAFH
jgi:hypothetical protein